MPELAFALGQVGLLDIDICGPSIPRMLGLEGEEIHQSGAGWSPVYVEDNLAVMSIGFMLPNQDDAVIWRGPRKNSLIKQFLKVILHLMSCNHRMKARCKETLPIIPSACLHRVPCLEALGMGHESLVASSLCQGGPIATNSNRHKVACKASHRTGCSFLQDVDWGEIDYLVVDAPPGTSDEHISIAQYLKATQVDGAVIVTTPQEVSLIDVRKEINFCKKVKPLPMPGAEHQT